MSAALHGVLVVDKPRGVTSAQVVARVKRALRADRVGHTGTLDPMATGVLPIVVGEGTKLAAFLLADDKAYDGELELGVATDTLDADGAVVARRPAGHITAEDLVAAVARLTGELEQVPPMHSALKQEGKRLYELARAGVDVERAPRRVRIDRFVVTETALPRARFTVECSKGTYVRALVRDVGEALGCGATLTALRRIRAGRFTLADAIPVDEVAARAAGAIVPPVAAVDHLPAFDLTPEEALAVAHGKPIRATRPVPEGPLRLVTPAGTLGAIAERDPASDRLRYVRVFVAHGPADGDPGRK